MNDLLDLDLIEGTCVLVNQALDEAPPNVGKACRLIEAIKPLIPEEV